MAEVRWCRPSAGIPFWLCATACAAWEIDFVPLNDERHFRASLFTVISVAYEPVWTDASTRAPFSGSRLGTRHTNKTLWCSILGKIKVWIMPTACSICAYIFIFTLLFSFSFPFFFLFFFFLCRVRKGFAFNAIPFVWWAVFIEKLMTKSFRHLSVCVRRRINEMKGSDRRRKKIREDESFEARKLYSFVIIVDAQSCLKSQEYFHSFNTYTNRTRTLYAVRRRYTECRCVSKRAKRNTKTFNLN